MRTSTPKMRRPMQLMREFKSARIQRGAEPAEADDGLTEPREWTLDVKTGIATIVK